MPSNLACLNVCLAILHVELLIVVNVCLLHVELLIDVNVCLLQVSKLLSLSVFHPLRVSLLCF